ncbi:hypothetical protein VE04_02872 [Pseudogymnoascus sp. 24MN13]|nr:hypothetical protein VE04_02872 [Pseudogymnoascus sp. 24MN13]
MVLLGSGQLPFLSSLTVALFVLTSTVFSPAAGHQAHGPRHLNPLRSAGHEHSHARGEEGSVATLPSNLTTTGSHFHANSSSHRDAGALVAAALEALAVRNKVRLDHLQFNKYELAPTYAADGSDAPSILEYANVPSNSTDLKRRQNSNGSAISDAPGPDGTYKYSIPSELSVTSGNHSAVAAIMRKKYDLRNNDTNAMAPNVVLTKQLGISVEELSGSVLAGDQSTRRLDSEGGLHKRAASTYWLANVLQRGASPYAPAGYQVWRNVIDYGAKGDGVTDDTAAINLAISSGDRCGASGGSSAIHPAIVFFPPGTYLVSTSIIQYYNTQFLGDPLDVPTILAASSFVGLGVISSDVYSGPGPTDEWYLSQNNFLRSVKNFKIDITQTQWDAQVCAIHWQVAQGTTLENIEFYMSQDPNTTQQGIYMENGSGGFMTDLTFVGGKFGAYFGNQQFTTSHLVFVLCQTAVQIHWDWAWTMQDIVIESCRNGIVIVGGAGGPLSTGQGVGSLVLIDAIIANTYVGITTSLFQENSTALLLQNVGFFGVNAAVYEEATLQTILAGGDEVTLESWGFGLVNTVDGSQFVNGGNIPTAQRPDMLLSSESAYVGANLYTRRRPKYNTLGSTQVFDVKALGAKGDGSTDDTNILNSILALAANSSSIVYFPHGVYIVKDTLRIPTGSRILGQIWPQIMGKGAKFQDASKPRPVVQVGVRGDVGVIEIQDMMFTVSGPTAGAIVVEWNTRESTKGSAGLWDCHIRVGGAIGSDLQKDNCPKLTGSVTPNCIAASLLLHLTPQSSAYIENSWIWTADHDLDKISQDQIDVYVSRGVLIESQGPTWLYGTASEHCVLYQYQFSNAKNILMAMIQTESPYYQVVPEGPAPFTIGQFANDPTFADCPEGSSTCAVSWGVRIIDSEQIHILGAGLYSWFSKYSQDCLDTEDCQDRVFEIDQSSNIWIYNLCTKAVREMVSPAKDVATIAADNKNGFMSSILAWVRNGTIGQRDFYGFVLYNATEDTKYLDGVSEVCKTALTGVIKCNPYVERFRELRYRGGLDSQNLTDSVCDVGCGKSLKSWFDTVTTSCADFQVGGAIANRAGGIVWTGYNETCLLDSATGQYCNDIISGFTQSIDIKGMPQNELCSFCHVEKMRLMKSTAYSTYDGEWKADYEYTLTTCGLSGSTEVLPPLIVLEEDPAVLCLSEITYTTVPGDTCDSIALDHGVASASIYMGSRDLLACDDIPAGLELCVPLQCPTTYVLQPNDTCTSIEIAKDMKQGDVRLYNAWVELDCPNLQVASAVFGKVLCLGQQASDYTTTATVSPVATDVPNPGNGYTGFPVAPPMNATVATGTTLHCGRWHVVQDLSTTCAIICVMNSIISSLFLEVNPSLSATNCDADLKVGTAYCAGPVYSWNAPPVTVTRTAPPAPTSSSTTAPPAPTGSGTTSKCKTWYTVQSGDTCTIIGDKFSITKTQINLWNGFINIDCSNLGAQNAVCVSSPVEVSYWSTLGCYSDSTTARALVNRVELPNEATAMTQKLCQDTAIATI